MKGPQLRVHLPKYKNVKFQNYTYTRIRDVDSWLKFLYDRKRNRITKCEELSKTAQVPVITIQEPSFSEKLFLKSSKFSRIYSAKIPQKVLGCSRSLERKFDWNSISKRRTSQEGDKSQRKIFWFLLISPATSW